MEVYLTSDLHLGGGNVWSKRGFRSPEIHDETIIENINSVVGRKAKLFILGDVCDKKSSLPLLGRLNGVKELIAGNHDTYTTEEYLKYFVNVRGFRGYKNFFLSHCPMHEQEMYRKRGNLHGHIHKGTESEMLDLPYFNVNIELHSFKPVAFETILEEFDGVN